MQLSSEILPNILSQLHLKCAAIVAVVNLGEINRAGAVQRRPSSWSSLVLFNLLSFAGTNWILPVSAKLLIDTKNNNFYKTLTNLKNREDLQSAGCYNSATMGNPQVETGYGLGPMMARKESACSICCVQMMRIILIIVCTLTVLSNTLTFFKLCYIMYSQNISSIFGYDIRLIMLLPLCFGTAVYSVGLFGACRYHPTALKTVSRKTNLPLTDLHL